MGRDITTREQEDGGWKSVRSWSNEGVVLRASAFLATWLNQEFPGSDVTYLCTRAKATAPLGLKHEGLQGRKPLQPWRGSRFSLSCPWRTEAIQPGGKSGLIGGYSRVKPNLCFSSGHRQTWSFYVGTIWCSDSVGRACCTSLVARVQVLESTLRRCRDGSVGELTCCSPGIPGSRAQHIQQPTSVCNSSSWESSAFFWSLQW